MALLSFMVLGDLLGPNSRLLGGNNNVIGEIAGEEITIQAFDEALQGVKQNYAAQTGQQPGEEEMATLREQTWGQLILKVAYQKEFDRLGIAVSDEELVDMVQGNNIHPVIKQTFVNQQTGQFDRSLVVKYLREDLPKAPAEQQAAWYNFEGNLGPERQLVKYNNLIKLSNYVTTVEANRYQAEQTNTASAKYLFVPFFSISDSSIKVTDTQLQAYLDENKERYKVEESRNIEYISISVRPSGADSATVQQDVANVVQQFSSADNDSLFVKANSDTPFNGNWVNAGALPEKLKGQALEKGKIFGPYNENGSFVIHKVIGVKDGGAASARASHILIKPENETPEAKTAAKSKAEGILAQIKAGADFAQMAAQNGQDGTAASGGDLGYFSEGAMVPPFEKAVFGATSAGLIPNLVETDFGYHIVKVTAPKNTRNYQIATVTRSISSSDATRDEAFRRADELAGTIKNLEDLRSRVVQDKTLARAEAKNIRIADRSVNNLTNARELVRWAFNDKTDVGDVSPVFEIGDQFVVAALSAEIEKGYAKVADIREELTAAVRTREKAKQIIQKLSKLQGPLEQMAPKYGPEAVVRSANGITFASATIEGLGFDPVATGKIFGLKEGARSKPFEGQTGVIVAELIKVDKVNFSGDMSGVKKNIETSRTGRSEGNTYQLIREKADIKDERVKFF
ncbi:MAG: peptidylprolyl isomerase [Adhaeribacter sp.]|nr:peptidylprolyl isomerase [Adhaeribacter sp.]